VLSGDIELGMLPAGDPVTHSPDADTHLTWFPVLGDHEVLAGFHLLHASALTAHGGLDALPVPLARLVPHVIERGLAALPSGATTLQRAEVRVDATVALPVRQLARPSPAGHAPAEWSVEPVDIARTVESLTSLARTLGATAHRFPAAHQPPTIALAAAVRELASVIQHANGRTAPGTAAAARASLTDHLPFEQHERHELLAALTDVDDTQSWPTVWALVDDLCASLQHSHALG
jgi:hypothetical protein